MILGAFILQGDMYTKAEEWLLVKELKKKQFEVAAPRTVRGHRTDEHITLHPQLNEPLAQADQLGRRGLADLL